jgi:hypothetical protein
MDKQTIYELYYENEAGEIVYCNDFTSLEEVNRECDALANEFPQYDYWWEAIYQDEQE